MVVDAAGLADDDAPGLWGRADERVARGSTRNAMIASASAVAATRRRRASVPRRGTKCIETSVSFAWIVGLVPEVYRGRRLTAKPHRRGNRAPTVSVGPRDD